MGQLAKIVRPTAGRRERAWRVAAVVLTVVFCSLGCDPVQMLNFIITPFSDAGDPPEIPLTVPDKESRVVIIATHDAIEDNLAFRGANDILTRRLTAILEERFKEHKDKVKIEPFTKVQAYLNKHPEWVTMSKQEIGKYFHADFVVYLEMQQMTMYEKGSGGSLYRGNVEINVAVIDVNDADSDAPKHEKIYPCQFPAEGPKEASEMSVAQFRYKFLEHVAKDLANWFTYHETRDMVQSD
jgi:hypothetical protein